MLDPLATESDLTDRNITIPAGMDSGAILNSASWAVRDAAGCPITETESTITLVVDDRWCFDLPAGPVSSVSSVQVASVEVAGWVKFGDSVRMPTTQWWGVGCLPVEVAVTYTHGFPVIPADIVDLVCGMASMGFAADGNYGGTARSALVKLGDYEERFNRPAGMESPSPLAVPDSVRARLRARFGTSVVLVGMR